MLYIIALIAGAVGGYILAMLAGRFSQGTTLNLGIGLIGGLIGQGGINLFAGSGDMAPETAASGIGGGAVIGAIIAGLVGGVILLAIVGAVRGRHDG